MKEIPNTKLTFTTLTGFFPTHLAELVQLTAGRDSSKATPKHHPTAGIVSPSSHGQRVSKGLVSSASDSPKSAQPAANYQSAKSQKSKSQSKDNLYSEYSSSGFKASPTDFTNVPMSQNKRYYQTITYHHRNPSFHAEKGSTLPNIYSQWGKAGYEIRIAIYNRTCILKFFGLGMRLMLTIPI